MSVLIQVTSPELYGVQLVVATSVVTKSDRRLYSGTTGKQKPLNIYDVQTACADGPSGSIVVAVVIPKLTRVEHLLGVELRSQPGVMTHRLAED